AVEEVEAKGEVPHDVERAVHGVLEAAHEIRVDVGWVEVREPAEGEVREVEEKEGEEKEACIGHPLRGDRRYELFLFRVTLRPRCAVRSDERDGRVDMKREGDEECD